MLNVGPHGFSEVLYAFTSAANNNGSAFAGITVNTPWWDTALGLAMLVGRFLPMVFVLGLAGSLARQRPGAGLGGHAADPPAAVRRHGRRRRDHPDRPDLPARPRARSAGRGSLVRTTMSTATAAPVAESRAGSAAACLTRGSCGAPLPDALRKLNPATLWRNPVMFIVEVGALFTTVLSIADSSVVRLADHGLALADGDLREPGRGGRRGPRQGAGGDAAAGPTGDDRPAAGRLAAWPGVATARRPSTRSSCGRVTSSSSRPARSSPATATSSRASPASTSRPSPVSRRRSSASRAATAARSPAAPGCSRTASS